MSAGKQDLGHVLRRRGKVLRDETKPNTRIKGRGPRKKNRRTQPLGDRFFEALTGSPAPSHGGRRLLRGGATGLKK